MELDNFFISVICLYIFFYSSFKLSLSLAHIARLTVFAIDLINYPTLR